MKTLLSLLLCACAAGCLSDSLHQTKDINTTSTSFPDGRIVTVTNFHQEFHFTRNGSANATKFDEMEIQIGDSKARMKGYANDQVESFKAGAAAAVTVAEKLEGAAIMRERERERQLNRAAP